MIFEQFAELAKEAGLQAVDCGHGHWRLLGGLVEINWWPFSKRRTIWANGSTGLTKFSGDAAQAIEAAKGKAKTMAPGVSKTQRMNPGRSLRIRLKWWKRGWRTCRWCGARFSHFKQMTLDHVVPLFRGGSNLEDNLTPACQECNLKRGHSLGGPIERPAAGTPAESK